MPRQQTEASHYLDIYKLTVEKKRLQQELTALDQRRDRIQDRLTTLERQITELDHNAQRLRESGSDAEPHSVVYQPSPRYAAAPHAASSPTDFSMLTLDY
ncbi:MAG: hypothetical protein IGR92_14070 [Leptolyngbyaceae cyanobacterium T60_A2020_046]|nr:hypothetical protein [Leptolyngbyaceae cyanobacterium T60_A2020_046]